MTAGRTLSRDEDTEAGGTTEALIRTGRRTLVMVARVRAVQASRSQGRARNRFSRQEVLSGLEEGQRR